jgi:hypothetical protein
MNKEILKILNDIKKNDQDKSLFYLWDNLPIFIQNKFIEWCEKYMQVSHKECFGGWVFGWSKYHEQYILWLKGKRKDLDE